MKNIDDMQIQDGQHITIREIEDVFAFQGFETTNIQLNELFGLMESGKSFNRHKFNRWITKNSQFLAKAPSTLIVQHKSLYPLKRNIDSKSRNTLTIQKTPVQIRQGLDLQ